jgi:hypothetical protein
MDHQVVVEDCSEDGGEVGCGSKVLEIEGEID